MHRSTQSIAPQPSAIPLRGAFLGTACCIAAALAYSAVNVCLRQLVVDCDPIWLLCVKESVAVAILGPWVVLQMRRGRSRLPGGWTLVLLVVVGLLTHLAGNLPMLWALAVVGLALTIPTSLGMSLVAGAVLGRVLLRERVSARSAAAISLLVASVVLLNLGAGQANDSMLTSGNVARGAGWTALAIGAACLSGGVFAALGVTLRYTATRGVPLTTIAFFVPLMGSISLIPLCLWRYGIGELLATPPQHLLLMMLAGVLNLLAFLAIIKGLQLTSVVHANVLSASQVAMAALAGLFFFQEASSPSLLLGVCLTLFGTILIDRPPA